MADNTLSIRLIDDGGSSPTKLAQEISELRNEIRGAGVATSLPYGSGATTQAQQNLPTIQAQRVNQTGLASTYQNAIGNTGLEGAFIAAKSEIIQSAFKVAGWIGLAGKTIADALNLVAFNIQKSTQAMAARVHNQEQQARLAEQEQAYGNVGRVAQMGGTGAGMAAGFMIGGPIGAVVGGVVGNVVGGILKDVVESLGGLFGAQTKQMLEMRDAIGQRSQQLSGYSGGISGEIAKSEVAGIGRDIAETKMLEGRMERHEIAKRQLDELNQIKGTLDKLHSIERNTKAMERESKKLASEMELLTLFQPDLAKDVKRIREAMDEASKHSPLDELEQTGMFRFEQAKGDNGIELIKGGLAKIMGLAPPIVGDK